MFVDQDDFCLLPPALDIGDADGARSYFPFSGHGVMSEENVAGDVTSVVRSSPSGANKAPAMFGIYHQCTTYRTSSQL